jgi:prephenate dehydratase
MIKVAFQGERGAFSEDAIAKFFESKDVIAVPQRSFADVIAAVSSGRADYGMLPVENTIAGRVVDSVRAIESSSLKKIGEVTVPIEHCLLVVRGGSMGDVSRAMSHPVALAQCTRFFGANSGVQPVTGYDTAGAAREVAARGDVTLAAIAPRRAAAIYGLDILVECIEDRADNETRFVVLTNS